METLTTTAPSGDAAEPLLRVILGGLSEALARASLAIEQKGGLEQAWRTFTAALLLAHSEPKDEGTAELLEEGDIASVLSEDTRSSLGRRVGRLLIDPSWAMVPDAMHQSYEAIGRELILWAIPLMARAAFLRLASGVVGDPLLRKARLRDHARRIGNRLKEVLGSTELQDRLRERAEIGAFLILGSNFGFAADGGAASLKPVARELYLGGATPTARHAAHVALTLAVANATFIVEGIFEYLLLGDLRSNASIEQLLLREFGHLEEEGAADGRASLRYTHAYALASHVFESVGNHLQ